MLSFPSPIDCLSSVSIVVLSPLAGLLPYRRKEHDLSPLNHHEVRREPASERDFIREWTPRTRPKPSSTQKSTFIEGQLVRDSVAIFFLSPTQLATTVRASTRDLSLPTFLSLQPLGIPASPSLATNRGSGSPIDSSVSRTRCFALISSEIVLIRVIRPSP